MKTQPGRLHHRWKDITGNIYFDLTVLEYIDEKNLWKCKCVCGKEIYLKKNAIMGGTQKSCGCRLRKQNGLSYSKEYGIYTAMISRCYNPNNKAFERYGGRGITVSDKWLESFTNFIEDMGYRNEEGLSLERIKNNEGYSKENCKWATIKEQSLNKRTTRKLTYNGETKTLEEFSKQFKIPLKTLNARYDNKWETERMLETKYKPQRNL